MRLRLLVGSGEFWEALEQDIAGARSSVLVQTLTFEGDAAGHGLARAMEASPAADRRIIVDNFTRHIQNDRFLWAPQNLLDRTLRAEVRGTYAMIQGLEDAGVGIRWVNPWGPLWHRVAGRNHKKLMLIDDRVAYIGGINFSDHNFAWHDMMLRIEDPEVVAFCRADFEHTWAGRDVPAERAFPGLELLLLDARDNVRLFGRVLDLIAGAGNSIVVESPYLSMPFTGALAEASARGVHVQIITPEGNNHGFLKRFICFEAAQCGFDLRLFQGMTHLKGMLIDDEMLVMGSSNFDYFSYRAHQEVVALVTDAGLVDDFRRRVLEPDLERSRALDCSTLRDPLGHVRRLQVRAAGWVVAGLAGL